MCQSVIRKDYDFNIIFDCWWVGDERSESRLKPHNS
ncbi:hypothetical protein SAMN05428984_4105 [Sphingomonas sp. OK281]|nr:hypothetical protein SAMN05428984_4105 [Sphingomonas sp. OK281]